VTWYNRARPDQPWQTVITGTPGDEPVHQCPPDGGHVFPCCGLTPFEVPRWHRMSADPELVTCGRQC
jgi:hypothetical protein